MPRQEIESPENMQQELLRLQIENERRRLAKEQEEEAKRAAELDRMKAQAKQRARDAAAAKQVKETLFRSCSHKMPDGQLAVGGQFCSGDNKLHLVCPRCEWSGTAEELLELAPQLRESLNREYGRFGRAN